MNLLSIKLHDFQQKALARIEERKAQHCALYHSMGLGKTFTGSEKLMSWDEPVKLIVCQKSKIQDWVEHMEKYYSYPVFNLTKAKQLDQFCVTQSAKVGVVNYDLLYRRAKLLELQNMDVLYDESSMLKNENTKRTKAAFKLKSKHNVLLSGTPVGGKYEELWSQCRLLGWGIKKKDFWDRYIITRDYMPDFARFPIKLVAGYKNVADLINNLKRYGADFIKTSEVITLPKQVFITIPCAPHKQYNSFIKQGVVQVEGVRLTADTPNLRLLYARELCSYYSEAKLAAFVDWVNSTQERLIVFYNFTEELNRAIKALANSRPISIVNGKTKDLYAYENLENSITFIQYQAGAKGLNLTKAHILALYSPTLSAEDHMQCLKRIHRISQDQTCLYYFFTCTDSVEEKIYRTLQKRENYTARLFEG